MTKEERPAVPAHERLRVGLLLAFVGGFLEVYTYTLHGKVFANAQTGNMALFAIYAMQRDRQALYYLVPLGAFLAGVLVSEGLRTVLDKRGWARWEHALVLAEAVLLAAIAFLPAGVPHAAVNVTVSFVCAVQFTGFRKTHGMAYATTFLSLIHIWLWWMNRGDTRFAAAATGAARSACTGYRSAEKLSSLA